MAHLEGEGFELVKHDLAKDPPSRELLERLVDERRLADFVNTRSPSYKARGLSVEAMTKAEAIELMLEDVNLMKRPLVLHGKRGVFGFKPEEYEEW